MARFIKISRLIRLGIYESAVLRHKIGVVAEDNLCDNFGMQELGYREEDGKIVITMTGDDWTHLLILFGQALAEVPRSEWPAALALINRLNRGNPRYVPYDVGEPVTR